MRMICSVDETGADSLDKVSLSVTLEARDKIRLNSIDYRYINSKYPEFLGSEKSKLGTK